jgi:hypothetical protein
LRNSLSYEWSELTAKKLSVLASLRLCVKRLSSADFVSAYHLWLPFNAKAQDPKAQSGFQVFAAQDVVLKWWRL